MPVLGIDVSHHNGDVNWHAVAESEVKFVFVKATEGSSFVDPRFAAHWKEIGETHLLRGAYHFARPGSDPEAEAAHFAATVGPRSWNTLPPVLDLESTGGLPPDQVLDWTLAFFDKAESLFGQPLMLYTGGLWRRTLGDPTVPELASRLLWTARYGTREPVVPKTWKQWDFWQFTDGESGDARPIPGVRGPCDCNRFRGDLPELQSLTSRTLPAPSPAHVPMPEPNKATQPAFSGRCLVWPHEPIISGDDVRAWQARMRELNYRLDVDGYYGRQSRLACIALQREVGIEPDGIVGRKTWVATFAPT